MIGEGKTWLQRGKQAPNKATDAVQFHPPHLYCGFTLILTPNVGSITAPLHQHKHQEGISEPWGVEGMGGWTLNILKMFSKD